MASFNIPLPLDLRAILNRNSSVILNADQPAAPPGSQNVAWQTDEFGNLSASAPSGVSPDGITQPGPDGITLLDEGGGGIAVEEPGNGTINIIAGGTGGITVADNGGGGVGIQSAGGVYFQGGQWCYVSFSLCLW